MSAEYEREQIWQAVKEGNKELHDLVTDFGDLKGDFREMKTRVSSMAEDIEKLVTRHEFDPIRLIVYGLVSLVLTGVTGALITLVITKH